LREERRKMVGPDRRAFALIQGVDQQESTGVRRLRCGFQGADQSLCADIGEVQLLERLDPRWIFSKKPLAHQQDRGDAQVHSLAGNVAEKVRFADASFAGHDEEIAIHERFGGLEFQASCFQNQLQFVQDFTVFFVRSSGDQCVDALVRPVDLLGYRI
jgi:hypothetical protein